MAEEHEQQHSADYAGSRDLHEDSEVSRDLLPQRTQRLADPLRLIEGVLLTDCSRYESFDPPMHCRDSHKGLNRSEAQHSEHNTRKDSDFVEQPRVEVHDVRVRIHAYSPVVCQQQAEVSRALLQEADCQVHRDVLLHPSAAKLPALRPAFSHLEEHPQRARTWTQDLASKLFS